MHRLTRTWPRKVSLVTGTLVLVIGLVACGSKNSGQKADSTVQQNGYNGLVASQPAHTMTYSPTRNSINFWIDTWNKPGQLAYTYLMSTTGDLIGYYVLAGPPVSMCTALTPNYQIHYDGNGNVVTSAPSIDGAYYSGGECNTYYGKDANTGAYIEFTLGQSMSMLLYNQPLPNHPNVPNLSPTAAGTGK